MSLRIETHPGRDLGPRPVIPRRRLLLLVAGLLVLVGLVGARTLYLASVRNSTLTTYAKSQQQYRQTLPAVRGDILDRHGRELAVGEDAVTFYANPKQLKKPAETAVRVAEVLKLSAHDSDLLVQRLTSATGGFVYVKRQVPRDAAQELEDAKIPGIAWYTEPRRMYPNGKLAGQLVGTVNLDNKGLTGLELLYNYSLTGRPGSQVAVVDPQGVPINVLKLKREQDGRDVHLTLDLTLQQEAERVLDDTVKHFSAQGATAIVLNPRTGAILAMAQSPRPNPMAWGKSPVASLNNKAVSWSYEPGSTFKVVAISAALEEGIVTPSTTFRVPYSMTFCTDNPKTCKVHDSHEHPTEWMSVKRILTESSNIGTIEIAQKVRDKYLNEGKRGNQALIDWIKRFGFLTPTGVDFPGEEQGYTLAAKDWSMVSIGNIPIGQGVSVTPMQLIGAYAAIANDGVLVQPHLLERVGGEAPAKYQSKRVLSVKTAQTMRAMFERVVRDEHGTGKKAGIPGYNVGGKTGTANVAGPDGYIKGQYVASFVGFVPAQNPKLVTLVVVDRPVGGEYGGDVAAPAFERITAFALQMLAIPPDGVM